MIQLVFLLFQTVTCYARPRLFILGYLLYHTFFLGFIDNEILVNGSDIGLFYQSLLMLIYLGFKRDGLRTLPKIVKQMTVILLLLYVCAIMNPILNSNSTFINAITASKEFSVYIVLPYLFCAHVSHEFLIKVVTYVGIYLLVILVLYSTTGWCPEYYIKEPSGIEIKYPTLISLFLFIQAGKATTPNKRLVFVGLLFLWVYGMLSEGHKSILFFTAVFTLIIVFASSMRVMVKNFRTVIFSVIGVGVLLEATFGLTTLYENLVSSSELVSRAIYNGPRLEKIAENPWFGLGFVHKNVLMLSDISIYMESLAVIDSGYIDLLGKFGFLGTILLVSFMFYYMLKLKQDNFSLKLFLVQYFLLCFTWSVFSYGFGILPLALFIYVVYRTNNIPIPATANLNSQVEPV